MQTEKRIHNCSHLTPVENEIANYILSHKDEVINYSIQELSLFHSGTFRTNSCF